MACLFVKHKVEDYDTWKEMYDSFADLRKEAGVTGASVYRAPDDPNTIIATHDFETIDEAMAFANDERLPEAMKEGGVVSQPEMWFGVDIEHTDH